MNATQCAAVQTSGNRLGAQGQPPKRVKDMIQNALNLINGIAFDSHGHRFVRRAGHSTDLTPGPGQYEAGSEAAPKRPFPVYVPCNPGLEASLLSVHGHEKWKGPGPGTYYSGSSLIKNSFNVTLPNNLISKRKEDVIKTRIQAELL